MNKVKGNGFGYFLDPCMNKVKGDGFGYFLDPSIYVVTLNEIFGRRVISTREENGFARFARSTIIIGF